MTCPTCTAPINSETGRVLDTRPTEKTNSIRRRRKCFVCGAKFTTRETIVRDPADLELERIGASMLKGLMGPYCNYCNHRCFVPFPAETPPHILEAYGTSTIIATCPEGQEFEKQKVGYCYDDIKKHVAHPTDRQEDRADRFDQFDR